MKKFLGVLVVLFLAGAQVGFAGENGKSEKAMAKKYEVVDVACYTAKGAHGADHKACAIKCINGGGELALLRNGDLFVPVDKDFKSARDKFKNKAGEMVEVSGKKISKGGVNYLQVE